MTLGQIVLKLRLSDTYFENKISGTVDEKYAKVVLLNNQPMAFVIPDKVQNVSSNKLDSGINQVVEESFSILVALRNDTSQSDKLGFNSYSLLDLIRSQIWKSILGWQRINDEYLISYSGGKLVDINPANLLYSFKFNVR